MTTRLLYFDDMLRVECCATVRSTGQSEKGAFVILDRTVAYPQGGGQPADAGFLVVSGRKIPLAFVGFDEGNVLHYIPQESVAAIAAGQPLQVEVDKSQRTWHSRLHTAGHLVSHVIEAIDVRLRPTKGHHFPAGAYVQFNDCGEIDPHRLLTQANDAIDAAIRSGMRVHASYATAQFVDGIRPHLAPFIPKDKPTRIISIGDYMPLPCGGTHVPDLGVLGTVSITKIKRGKDDLRVSYRMTPA
jgi:alanyl-tRNA synthetase